MLSKILGILKEVVIFPMNYFLSMLWFIPLLPKAQKGKPILLLHGYLNSAFVWVYFKHRLERQGFGPIYTLNLGWPFSSIETFAKKVQKKLEKEAPLIQQKEWICIGHSMGGLVAALYAKDLAKEVHFTDIITLGSPFHGTNATLLGIGKCIHQMKRHSAFLEELKVWMQEQKQVSFYMIASNIDHIIIPHDSAIFSKNYYYVENVGHGSMLFSSEVENKVASWLKEILTKE